MSEEGAIAARELADAFFGERAAADPILVARCLGRLTVGDVEWLEVFGADRVGTTARSVLDARRDDLVRLSGAEDGAWRAAAQWLGCVAGEIRISATDDGSAAGIVFEAHRVRAATADSAGREAFLARADARFASDAPRELRLAALIGGCIARPELGTYLPIDGKKDRFFASVPASFMVDAFPFRLGDLGALAKAVGGLTSSTSWDRDAQVTIPMTSGIPRRPG